MRISDWSSDVCSSDLQKILDDGLARAGRTDNQCVTQIADMEVEIIGRLRGRLHHGDRRPPMVPLGPACGIGMERRQGSKIARGDRKHTSELQSLMRISYAVFCLKTKNTKTQS